MKIGIYNEPSGCSIGGAEYCVAVLAEALSSNHQVDLVHHRRSLTAEELAGRFSTNLNAVRLRYVADDHASTTATHNPLLRYKEAQTWHATLSEPYDVFINFTHGIPPFCHAPQGVLAVLFPTHKRPYFYSSQNERLSDKALRWKRFRRLYFDWEWKKRFETYQQKTAISRFTRTWTRRRWGIDCQVIYPPVDDHFRVVDKKDIILSVGRFTTVRPMKSQLEMMLAYQRMKGVRAREWKYVSVGGLDNTPEHYAYFERVGQAAAESGATVLANVGRGELERMFEQAKIFWHASGYGENDSLYPELSEHFGIVTVEAMAAGCVPIVINKGGQAEIVEHGVSGFLWDTLEELHEYTGLLAGDEELRERMSQAARTRAAFFRRDKFVASFAQLLSPLP